MLVQEALDELRGSILRDVSTKKTGPSDTFWTDDALLLYIRDAQRRFARRTFCLREFLDPSVVQFIIRDGVPTYTLNPKIVFVQSARIEGDPTDLTRISHSTRLSPSDTYLDAFSNAVTATDNHPYGFSTDDGIDTGEDHAPIMTLFPTPDATVDGFAVNMRVSRLPLVDPTLDNLKDPLEIPEDYCLDMLEWAAWRALRNWDIDAEDRKKAQQHRDRFDEAVKEARREVLRKIFQPVKYRFGENGFAYTRRN